MTSDQEEAWASAAVRAVVQRAVLAAARAFERYAQALRGVAM